MARNNFYVPLAAPTREALLVLAAREYRRPQDQARLLLEEALRERGMLQPESAPHRELATQATIVSSEVNKALNSQNPPAANRWAAARAMEDDGASTVPTQS